MGMLGIFNIIIRWIKRHDSILSWPEVMGDKTLDAVLECQVAK